MYQECENRPLPGAEFASLDGSGKLLLGRSDVEDVREVGEEPNPDAGDPQFDDPLVGDLLPDIGRVVLRPQYRVLVGQNTAITGVDAVRTVFATTVFSSHVAGSPVIVLVSSSPVPPGEAPEQQDADDGSDATTDPAIEEPHADDDDDDGNHRRDGDENKETSHGQFLSEERCSSILLEEACSKHNNIK